MLLPMSCLTWIKKGWQIYPVHAALLSLNDMTKRLQQDHDNALMLAKGLASCPYVEIRTDLVSAFLYIQP